MATTSIKHGVTPCKLPALQLWLQQYGRDLASLQVDRYDAISDSDSDSGDSGDTGCDGGSVDEPEEVLLPSSPSLDSSASAPAGPSAPPRGCLALPCAELLQLSALDISGHVLKLQLPSANSKQASKHCSRAGSAPATAVPVLPKLVSLKLGHLDSDSTSVVEQLTQISTLTHLELSNISMNSSFFQPVEELSKAVAKVLQHLPLLQKLAIWHLQLDQAALAPLSSMQHLQDCSLTCERPLEGAMRSSNELVPYLPTTLTNLCLDDGWMYVYVEREPLTHGLQRLKNLQTLVLSGVNLHPSILANMPQMKSLDFDNCGVVGEEEGAAAFLAALGQMQKLERLGFINGRCDSLADLPPQQFTTLSALSRLDYLVLEAESDKLLPAGALSHMFSAGRQLPLQYVSFSCVDGPCLTGKDLRSLLRGCPKLKSLWLSNCMQSGSSKALLQLPPSLQCLSVCGKAFGDKAAAVVCQLTQLKELEWGCSRLTDAGLERLTALTGLSRLTFTDCSRLNEQVAPRVPGEGDWVEFVHRVSVSRLACGRLELGGAGMLVRLCCFLDAC